MHEPANHNTDVRPLTEKVSVHLTKFINAFTMLLYVGMAIAVAGLAMKYYAVAGGSFVMIFAMILLALLFMIQIVLSFFYVIANLSLALLGAFCSLALVLGFLALMFRFQIWTGWQIMYFISLPLFLVTAIFMGIYLPRRSRMPIPHRHFLFRNLMGPYLFILVLGILSLATDVKQFNKRQEARLQLSPEEESTDVNNTDLWRSY